MSDVKKYPMRLQKFLARAGVASRRGSENLMSAGRVRVNGIVTTELGAKVNPQTDIVTVDGVVYHLQDECVYLLLFKPKGYITTMSDPHARHTVAELVPIKEHPGLFPVGRLDQDTTGALLFTTDGDLAQKLLHPRYEKEKVYVARVQGTVTQNDLSALERGIQLDDGRTAPAQACILDPVPPHTKSKDSIFAPTEKYRSFKHDSVDLWLDHVGRAAHNETVVVLSIHEGRKHQVKRMFEAIGHSVQALFRPSFGPLELGNLAEGQWRYLSQEEMDALRAAAGE